MPMSRSDYLDIMKHPMDLSTIKEKVRRLEYKSREEFRHDVWQITYNAHKYNDGRNPAASAGHLSTIKSLASSLGQNEFMDLLKEQNKDMNTALHVALKKHHKEVAFFLIEADLEVSLCLNSEGKSPLYMAAEAGWADLVKLMMGNKLVAIGSNYVNDRMNGKSLVHAAITGKSREVLDIILSKNSILIHSIDEEGRSALSHSACIGYYNGVSYLLDKFIQGTYQRDQNGFFPIHMAASRGHVEIIQEFLQRCPDSSELLNKQGQNIVHVAAKNGKDNVIMCSKLLSLKS